MFAIFKNDPLMKIFKGGSAPRRRKKSSSRRKTLTASERRIVSAVSRQNRRTKSFRRPRNVNPIIRVIRA